MASALGTFSGAFFTHLKCHATSSDVSGGTYDDHPMDHSQKTVENHHVKTATPSINHPCSSSLCWFTGVGIDVPIFHITQLLGIFHLQHIFVLVM